MFPNTTKEEQSETLLAYKASSDPDTMYHHVAMRQHDRKNFMDAMRKEIRDQLQNGNFSLIHKSKVVPKGE